MESLKNMKFFRNYRDIYELNRYSYVNLAVLLAGAIIYSLYYLGSSKVDAFVSGAFGMGGVSLLSGMIVIVMFVLLGGLSLISLSERTSRQMAVVAVSFLVCAVIGILSVLYAVGSGDGNGIPWSGSSSTLSIMEKSIFLTALFFILFDEGDFEQMVGRRTQLFYVIPAIATAVIISLRTVVDVNPLISGDYFSRNMILTVVELILTLGAVVFVVMGIVKLRMRQLSRRMMSDIICVLILFIIAQISVMNSTMNSDSDFMMFQLFKIMSLAILIRGLYFEFVLSFKMNMAREENQLKLYVEKLNKVVERTTQEIREKNRMILTEIEYAKVIQQSLLPEDDIGTPGRCVFETGYFPCSRLSGDFYDIFRIDEDNYAMYIMDVSGHGIPAALLTMVSNNLLSASKRRVEKRHRALNPSGTVQYLYEEFNKMGLPDEVHLVIFYGVYNMSTRRFDYSSGGLNCFPIVIHENGDHDFLNESTGFPICKMGDFFTPNYVTESVTFDPSDTIVFYTDGLVDFEKNRLFSQESLLQFLKHNKGLTLYELNSILKSVIAPKSEGLNDDITYFMMRV